MTDLTVLAKSWRVLSPADRTDGRSGVVNTAEFCNKGLLLPILASKEEGSLSTLIQGRDADGGDHEEGLSLLDISEIRRS